MVQNKKEYENIEKHKVKMRLNAFVIAVLAVIVCMSGFAQAAEQPSPKLTLISNVNIFDGKTEKQHKNMHALVKDNRIETVSDEPLAVIQTDNATVIDGGGRTLMPGLIDVRWQTYYANNNVPYFLDCNTRTKLFDTFSQTIYT